MRHYSSNALQDAAHGYQQKIRNIPLLAASEEQSLGRGVQCGLHSSREQLIVRNLRLVMSLARRYEQRSLPLMDLVSEGHIGLIRAVEKFDPERGYRFSTYATLWIRQAIERALMNQERSVRLPIHVIKQIGRCLRTQQMLSQCLGRPPTLREVAAELPLSLERLQQLLGWHRATASTGTEQAESGADYEIEIADSRPDPDQSLALARLESRIALWLGRLDPRQRAVIVRRFGFYRHGSDTLEEIGSHVGLTRERVRQILLEALAEMRTMAEQEGHASVHDV